MVVAQLVQQSVPTPEICGSNPDIGKNLSSNCTLEKMRIKKKRPGMAYLKKVSKKESEKFYRTDCFGFWSRSCWTFFFFTRPCTYATVHSIDGAASNFFYLHFSGSARSRNFIVSGSVLPPYARANIFHLNKGDLGNRTPAASSASERFIHYTIAARAVLLNLNIGWHEFDDSEEGQEKEKKGEQQ